MPSWFYVSTVVIVASSVTMQMAYSAARRNQLARLRTLVWVTLVLGIVFLGLQWAGWVELVDNRVHPIGNPSGSLVYLLSGFHGLHIISALIFVGVVLNSVAREEVHSGKMVQMEMCTTYWHFLGILWVYLFLFLLINR